MQRWKVKLGPDRMPVEIVDRKEHLFHPRSGGRYYTPKQFAPGAVYVSAVDEMGAFLETIKWTEKHPL
jgi:hypothetical protein